MKGTWGGGANTRPQPRAAANGPKFRSPSSISDASETLETEQGHLAQNTTSYLPGTFQEEVTEAGKTAG